MVFKSGKEVVDLFLLPAVNKAIRLMMHRDDCETHFVLAPEHGHTPVPILPAYASCAIPLVAKNEHKSSRPRMSTLMSHVEEMHSKHTFMAPTSLTSVGQGPPVLCMLKDNKLGGFFTPPSILHDKVFFPLP